MSLNISKWDLVRETKAQPTSLHKTHRRYYNHKGKEKEYNIRRTTCTKHFYKQFNYNHTIVYC